jgi:NADPH2:quinone reductase
MTTIGTAGTPDGLALVKAQGAHHAVNHRDPNYFEEIARLTKGRGPDVIVEMLANVNLDRDLSLIAPGGRIVVVGSRGRIEIDPRRTMSRDASVLGMSLWNIPADDLVRIHAGLVAGFETNTLTPVVAKELPLGEAEQAHRLVMTPGHNGKIVLVP